MNVRSINLYRDIIKLYSHLNILLNGILEMVLFRICNRNIIVHPVPQFKK